MAEPWSNDFDALAAQSRHGLRSLDATRATSLNALTPTPQETKMRFFKSHPALAALFVFLALGLVSGAAYAVVHEVWITIDSHESAPQIEQDVQAQLAAQGVTGTQVIAKKGSDDKVQVGITAMGSDPSFDLPELHLDVDGDQTETARYSLSVAVACDLDDVQTKQLTDTASSRDVSAALGADGSAADRAAAIRKAFDAHGFHDVDVEITSDGFKAVVKAPPTP